MADIQWILWVSQCHKPPMTGNGEHTNNLWWWLGDGLLLLYPHYPIPSGGKACVSPWNQPCWWYTTFSDTRIYVFVDFVSPSYRYYIPMIFPLLISKPYVLIMSGASIHTMDPSCCWVYTSIYLIIPKYHTLIGRMIVCKPSNHPRNQHLCGWYAYHPQLK